MVSKSDLPSFPEYFPPAVRSLKERGGSATIEEMEEDVARIMHLSEEILAVPHKEGPRTQFQYELAWVRTHLKKFGAADNSSRGVWRLTELGERLSDAEVLNIPREVRARDRDQRAERMSEAEEIEEVEIDWKEGLLQILLEISPDAFERLCQRLLRESGFTKVEVTGRTGDGGIDGFGVLRVNLVSFHVLFQSKRWKGSVGSGVVRDFRGAMVGRADKGLIITTGTFSADARREATRDGAPAIDLIDGEALCDLLKERGLGVTTRLVEEIEFEPSFFAAI